MSQQLTLELSDEMYADLQEKSDAVGVSLTEWVVTLLSRQGRSPDNPLSSEIQARARSKFRSHAGAVSLGCATGIENDRIDADLAQAYANDD